MSTLFGMNVKDTKKINLGGLIKTTFSKKDLNQDTFLRYSTLGILLTVLAIFIVIQMIRVLTSPEAEFFRKQGVKRSGWWQQVIPPRGEIYDRWGHLLAGNVTVYEAGVDLRKNHYINPTTIALALSTVVEGVDYDRVYAAASKPPSETAVYAALADYITEEQKVRLEQLAKEWADVYSNSEDPDAPSLVGLTFTPHLTRSYPEKSLASNILGFVNREEKGFFGVEEYYNDLLAGKSRIVWMSSDPNKVQDLPQLPEGASLILTIDRTIQAEVEDILDKTLIESGAEGGTIVVMDPKTGEILAMATNPRLDLNEYWRYGEIFNSPDLFFNRAVSQAYEPGSVFKVLTMAAGLDAGVIKPDTPYLDNGVIVVGGVPLHNWLYTVWGPQDMLGCMQHSINVCLAWISSQLGTTRFYDYMRRFGIGHLTDIDLALEATGRLKRPGDTDWFEVDLGTNAFGQGVSTTPVQMLMAVSAIANDGQMVIPHIVHSRIENGRQYNTPVRIAGTPISADTAHTLSELLATSLETEASNALVEGYRISGKTGTAEIVVPGLGYVSYQTNTSFVGWGPVDDPRFLVYIWLEKPSSSIWASEVASPVFKTVVERLVVLMNLPPDDIRKRLMESQ